MKIFAGGPIDIEDAKGALRAASKSLDQALLKKLARGYGAEELDTLERLLKE